MATGDSGKRSERSADVGAIRARAERNDEFHIFNDYDGEIAAHACDAGMQLIQDRAALLAELDRRGAASAELVIHDSVNAPLRLPYRFLVPMSEEEVGAVIDHHGKKPVWSDVEARLARRAALASMLATARAEGGGK